MRAPILDRKHFPAELRKDKFCSAYFSHNEALLGKLGRREGIDEGLLWQRIYLVFQCKNKQSCLFLFCA